MCTNMCMHTSQRTTETGSIPHRLQRDITTSKVFSSFCGPFQSRQATNKTTRSISLGLLLPILTATMSPNIKRKLCLALVVHRHHHVPGDINRQHRNFGDRNWFRLRRPSHVHYGYIGTLCYKSHISLPVRPHTYLADERGHSGR